MLQMTSVLECNLAYTEDRRLKETTMFICSIIGNMYIHICLGQNNFLCICNLHVFCVVVTEY